MARSKRYWLFKSEPDVYSIEDLRRDGSTYWDGVRNYQARNLLRDDIKEGDQVLYYHSRVQPIGVAGVAKVVKGPYGDPTQFDKKSKYFDPKASEDNVRWFVVDIAHVETFDAVVPLTTLKEEPKLKDMVVTQRGSRLSVQPVTAAEFKTVLRMAKG